MCKTREHSPLNNSLVHFGNTGKGVSIRPQSGGKGGCLVGHFANKVEGDSQDVDVRTF